MCTFIKRGIDPVNNDRIQILELNIQGDEFFRPLVVLSPVAYRPQLLSLFFFKRRLSKPPLQPSFVQPFHDFGIKNINQYQ